MAKKKLADLPEFKEPVLREEKQEEEVIIEKMTFPKQYRYANIAPEAFLVSKGTDPPIRSAPVQNLTFDRLVELMNEFKG